MSEREKEREKERERNGEEREGENIKHILGLKGGAAVHMHKWALITTRNTQIVEEEEREGKAKKAKKWQIFRYEFQ